MLEFGSRDRMTTDCRLPCVDNDMVAVKDGLTAKTEI